METGRRALGRGLEALIQPTEHGSNVANASLELPLRDIVPNPFQPRHEFDETAIDQLASSIRDQGLLQPLLVRRVGFTYQLIAGERRWRAAQRAGLTKVPVVVRAADDRQMLELALIENLQRQNLNPIEEARAYQRLMTDFDLSQDETARRVGKDRSTVANAVRILRLPMEVQSQLASGTLSAGHARSLLSLASAKEQIEMAREVTAGKLSVRETERRARARTGNAADANHAAAENELARALGTRVRIRSRKGGNGRIEIEYFSLAELNGLIARLTGAAEAPVAASF